MAKMSNFSRSTIMLLILVGWLQLAWMVSITLANERNFEELGRQQFTFTQEDWDKNVSSELKEIFQSKCPNVCYEVYDEEKRNKTLEEKKDEIKAVNDKIFAELAKYPLPPDEDKIKKLHIEKFKLTYDPYSCESLAEKKDVTQNSQNMTKEDFLKKCKDAREIVCGSCIKHMHIRNPLAISLIVLLILLIIGGIAVGVLFAMRKGPFKKRQTYRQANANNSNAQQANPQTSNQGDQSGSADQSYGPGPGEPSHSSTQNFAPQ